MDKYITTIEIDPDELKQIFKTLHDAEQTIDDCYNRLRYLGVVTIKKAASDN